MNRQEYQRYLRSPAWAATAARIRGRAQGRCEGELDPGPYFPDPGPRCTNTTTLEVHHKHYNTIGTERDADLICLCQQCHQVAHVMRWECQYCGEHIFHSYDDALYFIKAELAHFHESFASLLEDRERACDYCEHMLSKDD